VRRRLHELAKDRPALGDHVKPLGHSLTRCTTPGVRRTYSLDFLPKPLHLLAPQMP
jgi:hypothetical protein